MIGIRIKQRLKSSAVPTIFPLPVAPKRLRMSSAFENRERARVIIYKCCSEFDGPDKKKVIWRNKLELCNEF